MKTKKQIQFYVTEEYVGQRLDRALTSLPEIISRNFAQDLILKNLVTVDQKIARSSLALKINQLVEVFLPEVISSELIPFDFPLDIVFEDDDLIVINKPSGLVVHPAVGHEQDTLVNALLHYTKNLSMKHEQRPGIVHRIDKETSGLLVVAKNDLAHEKLASQFQKKTTHRIYYGLVSGVLPKNKGKIQSYLVRHPSDRKRYSSMKENNKIITTFNESTSGGKWAVTSYEKIAQASSMSYLKLKLETGRTHQIRVHLSELGHPLVGDVSYGYSVQKFKAEKLDRFFLHAAELGFMHPTLDQEMLFKSAWPAKDLQKIVSYGFLSDQLYK